MEMTPDRWTYTCRYLEETFGRSDRHLQGLRERALAAGLPDIAVTADVGRLLQLLASTTAGRLGIEVGTLGGFSGIWIARGLPRGRLITIERDDKHADFALAQFEGAGVAGQIELRRGAALPVLEALSRELSPGTVDFAFLDADKVEYPAYWAHLRPLIAKGGLLVADNVLGSGAWWVDQVDHPARKATDALNRSLAEDPEFDAVAVPLREGLLIARRRD